MTAGAQQARSHCELRKGLRCACAFSFGEQAPTPSHRAAQMISFRQTLFELAEGAAFAGRPISWRPGPWAAHFTAAGHRGFIGVA
jgi:hypothetical protein